MGWKSSGTPGQGVGTTTRTVTVPTGVVATDTVLLIVSGSNRASAPLIPATVTVTNSVSATVSTVVANAQHNNMWFAAYKITGLVATNTITVTLPVSYAFLVTHDYFTEDLLTPSTVADRGGVTKATVVAPTMTVTAGNKVYVIASERSPTNGTTGTSSNSNAFAVTSNSYYEDIGTQSGCSVSVGEFISTGTATGTTTVTYSTTSGNAVAFHIPMGGTGATAATAAGTVGFTGTATASGVATAAGSVDFAGTAAGTGPGSTAAGAVAFAGTAAASAAATATGAVTFAGTATGATGAAALVSLIAGGVTTTTARFRADTTGVVTGVTVTAATNTGLTTGTVTSSSSLPDADGCVTLSLSGLVAGTDYFYGFTLDGTPNAARGQFRTPATVTAAQSFSFAAASCAATGANPVVFDAIRTRVGAGGKTAQFFTHLGDMHYDNLTATTTGPYLASTRNALAQSRQKALYASTQIEYTWSDHDFTGGNNADSTKNPAGIPPIQAAFGKLFPTYPLNGDGSIYRSWTVGRVRFLITDGRSFMSAIAATDNASKTKLGTAQKTWLKAQMLAARNAGQVVLWFHEDAWNPSSTYVGDDTWAAYTTERAEIASYVTGNSIPLMIIHGDYHALAADNGTHSTGGIPVVCASPLQQTVFNPSQSAWSAGSYPASGTSGTFNQYGWFDVTDTGGATVSVAFTGYSNDGTSDTSRITMTTVLAPVVGATAAGSLALSGAASPSGVAAGAGTLALAGTASVTGSASAAGAVTFTGAATATARTTAAGSLALTGTSAAAASGTTSGTVILAGAGSAAAATTAAGGVALTGTAVAGSYAPATASGSLTLGGTATAAAVTSGTGSLAVTGAATPTGLASSTGAVTFTGAAVAGSAGSATAAGSITFAGATTGTAAATAAGALTLTGVAPASATTSSAGTLTLTGTATAGSYATATAAGTITAASTVTATGAGTSTGSLALTGAGVAAGAATSAGALTFTGGATAGSFSGVTASGSLTVSGVVSAAALATAAGTVAFTGLATLVPPGTPVHSPVATLTTGVSTAALTTGQSLATLTVPQSRADLTS